jgi:integrase
VRHIGHLRLDRIKSRDLQLFIDSLSQQGVNKSTGKALAPKTIQLYHGFISNVFNYAIRMEMLTDNPCSRITLPNREKTEKPIYTREQTERFLELLQYEPLEYQVFFTIATYSGLRRGEMLGIEWKDIDWQSGVIKISRTSNYTKHRGIFTDKTKTERSKRLIKLPLFLLPMLREHQNAQDRERERLGSQWEENDRLFTRWNGSPMSPQIPYQWLRRFCRDNNLPFYGVHHFRHLFASLSLDETKDIMVVSSALGHTNPNITLSVYSHLLEDVQDKIPNAMANALTFRPKNNPQTIPKRIIS